MRLSQYFLPLIKETPAEATIASHQLMLRAGMIRQLTSGIYVWLPLGLTVLRKVEAIVREEMNRFNCELLMPTIQPASLWQKSGRYDGYGKEMLRIKDRHEVDLLYGPTNEEVITHVFKSAVKSYKQLPSKLYHIQWKFRDEIRPRFGVMRGREFLMKDAYSFDISHEKAVESYNAYYEAYLGLFRRLGVEAIPVQAPTGPIGGDLSHEFHILAKTGESKVYYDKKFDAVRRGELKMTPEEMRALYAKEEDEFDASECPIPESELVEARGIEVGHIFNFGTKYSEPMGALVAGEDGKPTAVHMGSYGIGVSRIVGALIEANHDEKGIIWPDAVAPYQVAILNLKAGDAECDRQAEAYYAQLKQAAVDVLLDDTKARPGEKFAKMELIGIPKLIVVGPKGLGEGQVEIRNRRTGAAEMVPVANALEAVS